MRKKFETGFSVYLSTGKEKNEKIIEKAVKAGLKYVFTSLNISEEKVDKQSELEKIIRLCTEHNLNLIVDINSTTKDIANLNSENVYLRIDDGFTVDEILNLSEKNKIVLNASTVTEEELEYMKLRNAKFFNMLSLHNFYPKKFTGISKKYLLEQNLKYKKYGIRTMAFVRGDELRGPVYEGLPTVEEHRNMRFLTSCLDLLSLSTDVILVGDINLSDEKWKEFGYLSKGAVPLRNEHDILTDKIFQDRRDFSEYVVRATAGGNIGETRKDFCEYIKEELAGYSIDIEKISADIPIKKGDILISNSKYLRYEGELEIALKNLGTDEKRCIISKIIEKDIELLDYISIVKKFEFIHNDDSS